MPPSAVGTESRKDSAPLGVLARDWYRHCWMSGRLPFLWRQYQRASPRGDNAMTFIKVGTMTMLVVMAAVAAPGMAAGGTLYGRAEDTRGARGENPLHSTLHS